jgi:ABC-2 type transport system permease protein
MSSLRVAFYALLVGKQDFNWNRYTWFTGWLIRILSQVAFFALVGKLLDSTTTLHYLVIGNAVASGCVTINIAIPATTWDRGDGTYPLLVVSPSSLLPALIGRTSIWALNGIATSSTAVLLSSLIFDLSLPWPQALLLVPLVALTALSVYAAALLMGSLVARAPRARNIFNFAATTMVLTFCGVSVPVSFWPQSVQAIANVLPLTHGLEAIRLLFDEASWQSIAEAASLELIVGLCWLGATILLIDRLVDGGRRDGSIDFLGQ